MQRLDWDTCRCSGINCPHKDSCQRYIDREYLGPRTGLTTYMYEDDCSFCKYKIDAKEYDGNY